MNVTNEAKECIGCTRRHVTDALLVLGVEANE